MKPSSTGLIRMPNACASPASTTPMAIVAASPRVASNASAFPTCGRHRSPLARVARVCCLLVTIARAFALGVLAALVLVLAVIAGQRLEGPALLTLVSLPLLAAGATAVFTPRAGWRRRLVRGAIGLVLAGLAGLAAFFYLKTRTDWFHWPDERGGGLFLMLLCGLAAVPGGLAAAAARPAQGLALGGGFACGLGAVLAIKATHPGLHILLGLGALVGTLVCALGRGRTCTGD